MLHLWKWLNSNHHIPMPWDQNLLSSSKWLQKTPIWTCRCKELQEMICTIALSNQSRIQHKVFNLMKHPQMIIIQEMMINRLSIDIAVLRMMMSHLEIIKATRADLPEEVSSWARLSSKRKIVLQRSWEEFRINLVHLNPKSRLLKRQLPNSLKHK